MPFRSQRTLEAWLEEFARAKPPIAGTIKVMQQDGEDGADTGLVGVHLSNASTVVYIQPEGPLSVKWVVTMEPRDDELVLDSAGVRQLADELAVIADLCGFLEEKSAAFVGTDSP